MFFFIHRGYRNPRKKYSEIQDHQEQKKEHVLVTKILLVVLNLTND